jgi:hypothetical protein
MRVLIVPMYLVWLLWTMGKRLVNRLRRRSPSTLTRYQARAAASRGFQL